MPYEPFHIERFFAATEFTTPWLLAVSDCESRSVAKVLELEPDALDRFLALELGYTPSEGSAELRCAVAATYEELQPDDVLVHATAVEVIFTVMRALLEPGDRVVVQMPAYQALRSAATLAGAEVVPWWGRPDRDWAPDLDTLDGLLALPGVRMLVVNTPHNPTGWHADETILRRILDIAEHNGVRVFCDEAYRGTEAWGSRVPSAADLSPTALALGLVSKGLGLPGLRTGWLATRDVDARKRVMGIKDYTSICGPAPSEFLAALALRHADALLAETRDRLVGNRRLLEGFMTRWAEFFDWIPPAAGPVAFPRFRRPATWGGTSTFCERARREAGVLLAPGALFGGPDPDDDSKPARAARGSIRIGFGRASFGDALHVLERWLEQVSIGWKGVEEVERT